MRARRRPAPLPGAAIARRREHESDRLATLTRQIAEAAGAQAPLLLGLIERRAPNVTAVESAAFILSQWEAGESERDRLIAHAMKDETTLRLERDLAVEIQSVLRPMAGRALDPMREADARLALVRFLRARLPSTDVDAIRQAAKAAVDYRADRLVIHVEGLAALLRPPTLAS